MIIYSSIILKPFLQGNNLVKVDFLRDTRAVLVKAESELDSTCFNNKFINNLESFTFSSFSSYSSK